MFNFVLVGKTGAESGAAEGRCWKLRRVRPCSRLWLWISALFKLDASRHAYLIWATAELGEGPEKERGDEHNTIIAAQ